MRLRWNNPACAGIIRRQASRLSSRPKRVNRVCEQAASLSSLHQHATAQTCQARVDRLIRFERCVSGPDRRRQYSDDERDASETRADRRFRAYRGRRPPRPPSRPLPPLPFASPRSPPVAAALVATLAAITLTPCAAANRSFCSGRFVLWLRWLIRATSLLSLATLKVIILITGIVVLTVSGAAASAIFFKQLLLAMRHDDAVVVLCVLEIVFSKHGITRRQRISRHRDVLLRDMRWSTPNFDVRPIGLVRSASGDSGLYDLRPRPRRFCCACLMGSRSQSLQSSFMGIELFDPCPTSHRYWLRPPHDEGRYKQWHQMPQSRLTISAGALAQSGATCRR